MHMLFVFQDYESIIESHNFRDNDVVNILDHE